MAQLSLRITTHYLILDSFLEVQLLLFVIAHEFDVLDEHHTMRECRYGTRRYQYFIDGWEMRVSIFGFVVLIVVIGQGHVSIGIFYDLQPTLVE